jgi:hypothetical protein
MQYSLIGKLRLPFIDIGLLDGICIIQMLQSQMILTSLFFGLNVYTIFADFLEQLSENVVMEYAVSCMHVF